MSHVGVVLISHSFELAKGLQKLLSQVQPDVPIAIAGGTEDGGIGTDPFAIKEAIEIVNSGNGVVLLFDLGSAQMNAEMAIEMIPNNENISLVDAPLVEGAYVAVVESGCMSTLEKVIESAEAVRNVKKLPY